MRDGFAILGLPRSLLLGDAEIEAAWRTLARDSGSGDTAAAEAGELHEARQVLRDPVSRLQHWIALRAEARPEPSRGSAVDAALMELFEALHAALGAADSVLERHRASSSALARALLAREALAAQLGLQDCLRRVQEALGERVARFPALEETFEGSGPGPALETLGQLKFLRKWERQAQERLVALIGL